MQHKNVKLTRRAFLRRAAAAAAVPYIVPASVFGREPPELGKAGIERGALNSATLCGGLQQPRLCPGQTAPMEVFERRKSADAVECEVQRALTDARRRTEIRE